MNERRESMRERRRKGEMGKPIGESHTHVGRPRYHLIVMSSEKQEVAHFVSIFTLTVVKSMHFGLSTSPHKMHHCGSMDALIGTKLFSHIHSHIHCHSFDLHPFGHKSIHY